MTIATLTLLGLGSYLRSAAWVSMLASGQRFVIRSPHMVLLSGLASFVIVLPLSRRATPCVIFSTP